MPYHKQIRHTKSVDGFQTVVANDFRIKIVFPFSVCTNVVDDGNNNEMRSLFIDG